MVRSYWWWTVFLLVYVFFLLQLIGYGDGNTPIKDYILMLIILPIFYISGSFIFRDTEDLMKILYIGVIIQSLIIIAALFLPGLTIGLALLFPEGAFNSDQMGGFEQTISEGYKVGLGVYSSAGSLKMAIGQIGACYFLAKNQGTKLFCHLGIYLIIAVATSVVARTGLIVSAIGLFAVYMAKKKRGRNRAFGFVSLVTISIIIGYFVVVTFFASNFLEDTFHRLIDTADKGIHETYFRGYTGEGGSNSIPPLSIETIIGLGVTYGVSGSGITTITDGGFMRNYSAMGLIVAALNYLLIILFFIKQYRSRKNVDYKSIIIFMFLVLLIGEFKEYFIYYISPMCFFFLTFCLMERDEKKSLLLK